MWQRARSLNRARRQRQGVLGGHIVTWDVDSRDRALCTRLRRFVFGHAVIKGGREYRYRGFVDRPGVRYLGQSVLFVTAEDLPALRRFLVDHRIAHHVTAATLGRSLFN